MCARGVGGVNFFAKLSVLTLSQHKNDLRNVVIPQSEGTKTLMYTVEMDLTIHTQMHTQYTPLATPSPPHIVSPASSTHTPIGTLALAATTPSLGCQMPDQTGRLQLLFFPNLVLCIVYSLYQCKLKKKKLRRSCCSRGRLNNSGSRLHHKDQLSKQDL